jgi:hypothetical protein
VGPCLHRVAGRPGRWGHEIWVAEGTYTPTAGTDSTAIFQLLGGVALYGGFAGGETFRSQRDWAFHETILSGDVVAEGINSDNSYHVVTGCDNAVLDGFTITRGNANGIADGDNLEREFGGGMANFGGSPTVTNCAFSDNVADWCGGGMCNDWGSSPTVGNCTFSDNSAPEGGGMCNLYSAPTVTDCRFFDNGGRRGGGMYDENSSPTVTSRVLSENFGGSGGGEMYNDQSNPRVTDCAFSDSFGSYGAGGGMYNVDSDPKVTYCTFSANAAYYHGGGMYNVDSSPTVTNCSFDKNVAADNGGGMYTYISGSPTVTVTDCTFSGNDSAYGGGMGNSPGSSPTVKNTILTGNSPENCDGEVVSGGYNLELDTSYGCTAPTDQQNTDPLLGPLADNGGPTLTHALLPGSTALDAIPAPYNDAPPTDQRGLPRPYPSSGFADIGAVEMQLTYSRGDVNGDGEIDLLDVVLCAQIAARLHASLEQRLAADMDRDGDVDGDDVRILSDCVLAAGGVR